MKLLSAALPLLVIVVLKFFSSTNKVAALAPEEDTMENVNDIDFNNASSRYKEGGFGVDVSGSGATTPTTVKALNNFNGVTLSRGKRFISFPVGSSFSVSETFYNSQKF